MKLVSKQPDPEGEEVQILGVFHARALNAIETGLDASPVEVSLRFHNHTLAGYSVSIGYPRRVQISKEAAQFYDKAWGFHSLQDAERFFIEIHDLGLEEWSKRYAAELSDNRSSAEDDEIGLFQLSRNEEPEPRKIQRWVYQKPPEQPSPPAVAPESKPVCVHPPRTPHTIGPTCPLASDAGFSFFSFGN